MLLKLGYQLQPSDSAGDGAAIASWSTTPYVVVENIHPPIIGKGKSPVPASAAGRAVNSSGRVISITIRWRPGYAPIGVPRLSDRSLFRRIAFTSPAR